MGDTSRRRQHVWVAVSGGYRCPGLVLAWRRAPDGGWEAQTAVVRDRTVLVSWLPAAHLRPVVDDAPAGADPGRTPHPSRRPPEP